MTLDQIYQSLDTKMKAYPVTDWQPELIEDIGLRIDVRGDWWQHNDMIRNERIKSLFSRLLVKELQTYYLKTPNVKFMVHSTGLPLRLIDLTWQQGHMAAKLADGREFEVAPQQLVPFCLPTGEDSLFVALPGGCEAQASRQLFYRLVEQATEQGGGRLLWHNVLIGVATY
ncbi:DUF1285 domain-containing protein [Salinibius halmophilus]|uniref:DUF1285 domain-containing protein n=1 Tax=Salinibius halmophilus TaxID=1853216 RepID=UPI000E66881A|nr:DUF1285 domain-containing protein [Salinibius halmophilus]